MRYYHDGTWLGTIAFFLYCCNKNRYRWKVALKYNNNTLIILHQNYRFACLDEYELSQIASLQFYCATCKKLIINKQNAKIFDSVFKLSGNIGAIAYLQSLGYENFNDAKI